MCGKWPSSDEDLKNNRSRGFGLIIKMINGGLEYSDKDSVVMTKRNERIDFFRCVLPLS
jgi:hypothetical protein